MSAKRTSGAFMTSTMKKVFAFLSVTFLAVVNLGCSTRGIEPNPETVTSAKPQESIFTVIETEDLAYPTLAASIRLPFRVRPNNTVVLAAKHAYLTTQRHLHVIDVSIPQRPVYLTSLAFPDDIGKALVSGHHIVVATRKKLHLVDVGQPSHPVLESTQHLPEQHAIKDIDVRDTHLYVLGANDALYIFSIVFGQARLVKAVELEKRWWLLHPKATPSEVEQILLSTWDPIPSGIMEPLLSQRGFLALISSKQEKVRASSDFLIIESLKDPMSDLLIGDAARLMDHPATIRRGGENPIISTAFGPYNLRRESIEHLSATEEKPLTRRKPTIAYAVGRHGKMQQIAQAPASETIDVDNRRLMGPVTDFQISEDLLYVVNAKGFFSIIRLTKIENSRKGERSKFLSATPLQASRPVSIAVGDYYACVLAAPE